MKDVDVAVIYTDGSHTESPKGSGLVFMVIYSTTEIWKTVRLIAIRVFQNGLPLLDTKKCRRM